MTWPHLWTVVGSLCLLGAAALGLHSTFPHSGAVTEQEQEQRDKRRDDQFKSIDQRLTRIENTQQEILRRVK